MTVRLDKAVQDALDATGLEWKLVRKSKRYAVELKGHTIKLTCDAKFGSGHGMHNTIARIRRIAEERA